jgi:ABC-type Fe3+ transport system permease subunit
MNILLIIVFLIVALLFGLSSNSQSYASAKQAQAAIEASRAAQIASAGNIVIVALLIGAVVIAVVLLTLVYLRMNAQPKRRQATSANLDWDYLPQQHQSNAVLPTVLTMLLYQLMQSQHEQHQQETEQFWMMHEPANDLSVFSENTWDM